MLQVCVVVFLVVTPYNLALRCFDAADNQTIYPDVSTHLQENAFSKTYHTIVTIFKAMKILPEISFHSRW
jgi:hypothetical protein